MTRSDLADHKVSVLAGQGRKLLQDKRMARELEVTFRAIHNCVADVCGESAADVIERFAPSSVAVYDPADYESSLARIIPSLSERVIKAIEQAVSMKAGVWVRQSESLFGFMVRVSLKKGGMRAIINP